MLQTGHFLPGTEEIIVRENASIVLNDKEINCERVVLSNTLNLKKWQGKKNCKTIVIL